ncbi:MAG: response regulator [Alphaproteobacteria bacterium]|nr:response regulator [Alphaproteobacteria bacterium]MBU1516314.1 response regulator [Alphaproteobacteria bacterium]MBU2093154.1 response regulator [Alphaproteobacteria bacterium]MBU2150414.1 response regulator [Alphaproteobacteria bacterium]MBU2308790.1 response regulator [Alphaproteobacteria bacterium]
MRRPSRPLSERRPNRAQISAEQLASLSHEFRTPLNGVLGMARLLEGTKLTAEQKSYVAALHDSGQHLLTLVNDVLDYAKLGAGRVELHPAPMEVESLLRGVSELLSPRAREKGIEIAWAAPATPAAVQADEGRLRQILLNFAGNAVKFTETGGVLIAASVPKPGRLRLRVEDTGPGVSQSDRERIFEEFAQAEAAHADLGGAGLGLAIARRLAHAMGGEVGVDTAPGGGACFWFEASFPAVTAAVPARALEGRIIGVASPNPIVREAARLQIEACGGEMVATSALPEAIARTKPGDVILVDAALATPNGTLRPPLQRHAIVLLAPDERDRIARYRRAGFAGYLIKPLRRASLAERVLIAAGAVADPTQPLQVDERATSAAAPGARILLVEDNPINALLARALLAREGCEVEHAIGGTEALAAVEVEAYDLILMDMRMPGLNGEQTARKMRENGVKTPIVALTANAFEDDRHACLAAGMDDFLVKPLSPDALRAALTRWTGPAFTKPAARAKFG